MMNARTKIISIFIITMLAVLSAGIGLANPRQRHQGVSLYRIE
jgi:hypothetical protein